MPSSSPKRQLYDARRHRAAAPAGGAAFAGLIPQRSATSRRVDFHALRKSCARILIELNIHRKVIQQTLRHSDIRLTMDLYGELGEDDLFRELPGKFPVPKAFAKQDDGVTATAEVLLHAN